MKKTSLLILTLTFIATQSFRHGYLKKKKHVIVWQPSHQTDTGKDFSEAATCGAIVDAAIETKPHLKEYKVWSLGRTDVHHADSGSNTVVAHTTAIVDGRISGYAYELEHANKKHPEVLSQYITMAVPNAMPFGDTFIMAINMKMKIVSWRRD